MKTLFSPLAVVLIVSALYTQWTHWFFLIPKTIQPSQAVYESSLVDDTGRRSGTALLEHCS